jgi:DNA-directed RNA polymerase subunit RPC12/RpoP
MPEITFICPHCSGQLQSDSEYSGESGECPYCSKPILIPELPKASPFVEKEEDDSLDGATTDRTQPPNNDSLPQDPAIPIDQAPSTGGMENRSGKSWGQRVRSLYEIKPYESGWNCPACGGLNPDDNTACRDCGQPVRSNESATPPLLREERESKSKWLIVFAAIVAIAGYIFHVRIERPLPSMVHNLVKKDHSSFRRTHSEWFGEEVPGLSKERYVNFTNGFSILFPADWLVKEVSANSTIVKAVLRDRVGLVAMITVGKTELGAVRPDWDIWDTTGYELLEIHRASWSVDSSRLKDWGRAKIDGRHSSWIWIKGHDPSIGSFDSVIYCLVNGGFLWTLSGYISRDDFIYEIEPLIAGSLSSFRFDEDGRLPDQ